jgi:hypothetical protein
MKNQKRLLSRDQWLTNGRIVCVPNEEAHDAVSYWPGMAAGLGRGAWHVFSYDQTAPVAQFQHEEGVAA